MSLLYDSIGQDYDVTRRADPRITQRIVSLLNPSKGGEYLDLGCGTGNYTIALRNLGLVIRGVDQSELMISGAKDKAAEIPWHIGNAEALPFATGLFDGVTCILAVHQFRDLRTAFKEARRVINRGRLVIFTAYPEQMLGYWLNEYFPRAMRRATQQMLSKTVLFEHLESAGFARIMEESFGIPPDLQHLFLQSGKHRPTCSLRSGLEFRRSQISHLKTKSQRGASDSSRISGQAVFTRWWQILRLRRVTTYLSFAETKQMFPIRFFIQDHRPNGSTVKS